MDPSMKPWLVPDPWERELERIKRDERGRFRPHSDKRFHADYEALRRRRKAGPEWITAVGGLHELGCRGGHRRPTHYCRPIPVYEGER